MTATSRRDIARFNDIQDLLLEYNPQADIDLLRRAYVFAAMAHGSQTRADGGSYLFHPVEVAYILARMHMDMDTILAGLLHDTIEDTAITLEQIKEEFGADVAFLVDGVTKLSKFQFNDSEQRKAESFRKMLVAMAKDLRVILLKLADRLHNMRTLYYLPERKQVRIAQETSDIYVPLANRLGISWIKTSLEDMSFKYLLPKEYAEIEKNLASRRKEAEGYIREVDELLAQELRSMGLTCEARGRLKHSYGIYRKMMKRRVSFDQVYDLIGFRVILDSRGDQGYMDCYKALGVIHSKWIPVPGRFKDYIKTPKTNGYQSIHTAVIGPEGERIEIQIRTKEMNEIAEEGAAAHWKYKEGRPVDHKDEKRIAWLRNLLEWKDEDSEAFLDAVKRDLGNEGEIFIFTPQGAIVTLPKEATPVDFAFTIHSEVGSQCSGARVNGRLVPLRYQLQSGDIVQIITNPSQKPNRDWLQFIKTARARHKVRRFLLGEERERSRAYGKEILEKECRKAGLSYAKLVKEGELLRVAQEKRFSSLEDLMMAVGYGRMDGEEVARACLPPERRGEAEVVRVVERKPSAAKSKRPQGILVQGLEDVLIRFAKCCKPVQGDPIVGFITRGRGVTVHTKSCRNAVEFDPKRQVDVHWDKQVHVVRPVTIRVTTDDRPGVLAMISDCISRANINISQAVCKATGDGRASNTFEIPVVDTQQLQDLIHSLERLKGVLAVKRF